MWTRMYSKVKRSSGSTVDDLRHHIIPMTRKKVTNLTKHAWTNSNPREIQDNLLKLKSLVNEKLAQCKVWLSAPTLRTGNGKATLTVSS